MTYFAEYSSNASGSPIDFENFGFRRSFSAPAAEVPANTFVQ
jgi:hypothetical protein